MNSKIDLYLKEGCGRCSLYQTPECKVHSWKPELIALRQIVLECELDETYKWSQPCYTYQGKNILLVTAFKGYATIAFFKGSLLKDPEKLLFSPGDNSQASKQFRFTDHKQILDLASVIKSYILEAIEVEKAGLKVAFKKAPEPMPEELVHIMANDVNLKTAFAKLTPGRQRGYILHISQPKQSKTRISRIEKCIPKILAGKGFHDY
ncbi:MAG: YdeI/OmpD-associated family protein [Cyclobacteriaceae bacterium]